MDQLLQNALCGTALILAAALLRRALGARLIPEARLCLWAACLFRLLTPAAPESVLSLWGLFRRPAAAPVRTPQFYIPAPVPGVSAPVQPQAVGFPWETALALVWLGVGLGLAARYALCWARTRRAVGDAIPLERGDPRYVPLPRCARLREGPMEGAPLTFGALRPTVVLSPGLAGEELACVLAHEGVHARRRDNLWHYAMAAALVVHWWNPAVWLMARLLRRDIELACDRAALKKLGEDRRADYARALVSLATQGEGPAFSHTFGRKLTEERILSIMKFKKTTIVGAVLSLTLVLAVTVAFASAPKEPDHTVAFHGQTFNRADLSQETLDWLDWYLSLSEEEQLAVSYVPAELRPGGPVKTQNAYDSAVRTSSGLYDPCRAGDCAVPYEHCHIDGKVVRVYYENPGLLCAQPGCETGGPHEHDGVQYAGKAGAFVILNPEEGPVPSAPPELMPTMYPSTEDADLSMIKDQLAKDEDAIQYYAYLDLSTAEESLRPVILEARKMIIFRYSWVAGGLVGFVHDENGTIIEEVPQFSDLFPSDWDEPTVSTEVDLSYYGIS